MFSFYVFLSTTLLLSSLSTSHLVHGNTELRALMELKSSLDPTNKLLNSWMSKGDPCSGIFEGVACNEHRKVANISLQGKGLSGSLSPSVSKLKCLSGLYLHYNSLSGDIPKEIADLTELSDLYLNVNNLSVLELSCNKLTGSIPIEIGSSKKLTVLSLQRNRLSGQIPVSLKNLVVLERLGTIPPSITDIQSLRVLDVRNNSLYGIVPSALVRLHEGFQFQNNRGLCGVGFPGLRACAAFDNVNTNQLDMPPHMSNGTASKNVPDKSSVLNRHCNQTNCSKTSNKLSHVIVVVVVIMVAVAMVGSGCLIIICNRRHKQKIGSTSSGRTKDCHRLSHSPLPIEEYSNIGIGFVKQQIENSVFDLEEIEFATHCFSDANLLGRNSFSSVYKGTLKDGSVVAIRSINLTSCKSEEAEFLKGLNLLTSLRHDNLVKLQGFCFSRGRGECYLVYDFIPEGSLSRYLHSEDRTSQFLDWCSRVSIINGTAKGIGYLHSSKENEPAIVHGNISADKILLGLQLKPLIADSGLSKLLADDFVFSALKMGCLAPEYVTAGRFTEKSDVYAFGMIVLQILSGKQMLSSSVRSAVTCWRYEEFVDRKLDGKFSEKEVGKLTKIAVACINEVPDQRPTMELIIQQLNQG